MRAALPVIRLGETQEENLGKVIKAIGDSSDCDFIFFAETTISGLIPNDNVPEMLSLGREIPGEITDRIAQACRENNVWVSIGLLEREGGKLFDSAVTIDPSGRIVMKYRRISPGWHWPGSDPEVFRQGSKVFCADTPLGRMASLICGDFFDEQDQIERLMELKPDFLHLLLVRAGSGIYTQEDWEKNDMPEFSDRVRSIGIPVFMVNYIHDGCYGGAAVLAGDGTVLSSLPIWQEGILKYDIDI